jgi:hypothetical protein
VKHHKRHLLWQIVLYAFLSAPLMSQGTGLYLASLGCQAVVPEGPLKRHYLKVRPGMYASIMKQLGREKPLFVGLGMDYHSFGTRKAEIEELLDFKAVDFSYSTTSNTLSIYGSIRYYLPFSFLPADVYAEGMFGIRTFFTNTSKTLASDEEFSDLYTERSDAAPFYGLGLGWNLPLGKSVYVHLHGQYQWIKSASYDIPDRSALAEFSSADLFIKKQSSFEYVMLGAGITLKIDSK